ncbi:MAG TPA: glycosyltransferase [Gemmatimonadales bacterium]|nr:glycosyltransferase [Gemmatimonadales bacterium]
MKLCVISFKQCWQDAQGRWYSYGGFPAQMDALRTLCDDMTILIVRSFARDGGMPLPADARVIAVRSPVGVDFRRKLSILGGLPYYLSRIDHEIRGADLVHTPVPGDLPYLGLILATARRKPLFALYNGSWTVNSQTTVMNRITRQTMRRLARNGGVMMAVGDASSPPSPGMEWLFATSLTQDEVAATPVNDDRNLSHPPQLIYAGRLSVEKGVPVLLEALHQLKSESLERCPMLTLAGDGPERSALQRLVGKLGLTEHVRFAGQLDRAGLAREFRAADLCVHPSHTEGYCKAWLDAMSQGLPVLTTNVGAAQAVVGETGERGWLVQPGDPAALRAMIRRALTDTRDWSALRTRCRAFANARTLEAWAEQIRSACERRRLPLAPRRSIQ